MSGENFNEQLRNDTQSIQVCDVETQPHQDHQTSLLTQTQQNRLLQTIKRELDVGDMSFEGLVGGHRVDLLELCAPWDSPLCQAVRDLGGKAISLGLHNGYDLTTVEGYRRALQTLRHLRPRYLHISPPCFLWSAFQNCTRREGHQLDEFLTKRASSKKLITKCRRLLEVQLKELDGQGGQSEEFHGGGEHPLRAQSWKVTDMGPMAKMCGGRFTVHGCCHGMFDVNTKRMIKKPWGWFSSSRSVRHALESHCRHEPHQHISIEGERTARTATYPRLLCVRFAKAILNPVKENILFHSFENTALSLVNESPDHWNQENGMLIRYHATAHSQAFKPNEVECPVPDEQISSWRKTVAVFSDGTREEKEDNWREATVDPFGPLDKRKDPGLGNMFQDLTNLA